MKKLVQEAHRRSLWQVLGIYLMGSWIVLQVVDQLHETAGLPDWVPSMALVLLLIGLPMVLATAFVQEGMSRHGSRDEPESSPAADDAASGAAPATPSAPPGIPRDPAATPGWIRGRVLTWRNALAGGIAALALFGAATAAWMVMRSAGIGEAGTLVARGLIADGERVVLADFSGDSALAQAATMSLRVQLSESGVVSVAEPSFVRSVLQRMAVEDGPVDLRRAREVAEREGINAVVAGDVAGAGGGYIVTARVVETATGNELVNVGESVSDPAEFLAAVDQLGRKLRERLGESLGSIRNTKRMERATTTSIEALRKYTRADEAFDARDLDQAVALLEEAIALDSSFAMAWRKLAVSTFGDRRREAARRAYELRDRLTERERYHAIAIYQSYVMDDDDEAITAYRALIQAYPDDATALNNLAVAYQEQGQLDLAAEMFRRALDTEPYMAHYYPNLIDALYDSGRIDSALVVLDSMARAFPGHPNLARKRAEFAYLNGDLEAAEAELEPLLSGGVLSLRRGANFTLSELRLREGKLQQSMQAWEQSQEDLMPFDVSRRTAFLDFEVHQDTAGARARMLAAIDAASDSLVDESAGSLAYFFYRIGDLERGDRYYERNLVVDSVQIANIPERFKRIVELNYKWDRSIAQRDYEAALATGREMEAEALRETRAVDPANWADEIIPAFEGLGMADSVIARYEAWMGRRQLRGRISDDSPDLPLALERLGQLYDAKGDTENAALYYAQFVEMWEDADADLQPRVAAARARLEEILRERG
jgi:tetratricopeptide (TPR) repeat protein